MKLLDKKYFIQKYMKTLRKTFNYSSVDVSAICCFAVVNTQNTLRIKYEVTKKRSKVSTS